MIRNYNDKSGVTNVVSMIMIIGIITSMMGMVFATYLPAWGKEIEVKTQMEVMNGFFDLKSGLDTLSVGGDEGASLSTKFRLGSQGGPLFGFGRSYGSLDFNVESGMAVVSDQTGSLYGQGVGEIEFTSDHLYIEDNEVVMEHGAIIKTEGDNDILKGPPNIVLKKDNNTDTITLFLNLMTMESSRSSIGGTQSYMVTSSLLSEDVSSYRISSGTDISLRMNTDHVGLWTELLRNLSAGEGLVEGASNDYSLSQGTDVSGNEFVTVTYYGLDELKVRSTVFRMDVY